METLTKNILDIITAEVNLVNEKVKGLNFLEILKNKLIEKISPIINDLQFPLVQFNNIEKELNENTRRIKISIKYFDKSSIIRKKIIDKDSLFIFFNEACNLDLFKNDKNFVSIFIHKNTGVSLSKNTAINSKFNKSTLFIEIQNKDDEQILKK